MSKPADDPKQPFITVTGADERTDLSALSALDAEIGLLFTATPEGRNRYPSHKWLALAAEFLALNQATPRIALHVCGRRALLALLAEELPDLTENIHRIQVNGVHSVETVEQVCELYPSHWIITQCHNGNRPLEDVKAPNHALLMDSSGGRGLLPTNGWTRPETAKRVGFAGGLGPDNLEGELPQIAAVARGPWWIDMEGRLRIDDWFSNDLAKNAVCGFHRHLKP